MDNREKARILATQVHRWHKEEYKWLVGQSFWANGNGDYCAEMDFDPATNDAQAIEAGNAWLDGLDESILQASWVVSREMGTRDAFAEIHIMDDDGNERYCQADAATEALALTEALVEAVSDAG